ncbi:MaoC/PaaZ C-terminal domain-containing protein [Mesorhizobium sp. CAU 1741]|uniref:MaoC/PaaZ C-terminal domain-containing protein n=1 Tax=Mesorhizobium sp. CAU 1741 TaxID=3140366 RepID=UPI00325B7029
MTMVSKTYESVTEGEVLPLISYTVNLHSLVKYAAATWDFHRYHYDAEFAKSVGMPAPFADGQMFGALLARLVMSWAGRDAFMRRLQYRQNATVFADETIIVTGQVRRKSMDGGKPVIHVVMAVTKADGTSVIRDATAQVELAPEAAPSAAMQRDEAQ